MTLLFHQNIEAIQFHNLSINRKAIAQQEPIFDISLISLIVTQKIFYKTE
ncbi:MAG: hypothetical protein F6K23_03335 [Okeania sp. SIO2C9]|nr:hypothetical protein [Okeania sp. SIO2C9]NEQ72190.1 hypothetical protein [Okeania sp. SIO2C9]